LRLLLLLLLLLIINNNNNNNNNNVLLPKLAIWKKSELPGNTYCGGVNASSSLHHLTTHHLYQGGGW
jgi:hypothetical protein